MSTLTALLALGFLLGMRHATDADHVVAISTIVTKQRSVGKAGLIGVLWGLGHTFTDICGGCGDYLVSGDDSAAPRSFNGTGSGGDVDFLGHSEFDGDAGPVTGEIRASGAHFRAVTRSGAGGRPAALRDLGMYGVLRPIAIGLVHGLAGSAAVALLVLATIRDPWWAMVYLVVFGFGTVAGMMFINNLNAMPLVWTGRRFSELNRKMAIASGLVSLAFGVFLTYQIAIVDGLFRAHPLWTASLRVDGPAGHSRITVTIAMQIQTSSFAHSLHS